jgi:membrane associated rhomboid family serine protease
MPAACSAIRFDLRRSGMLESRESRLAEACVIPFRDDNPTRSVPIVTIGLIAVNVAVYLYQVVLPGLRQELFIYTHAAIPAVLLGQVGLEQVLPHQLLAAAHHYHIPILPVQPAWLTIFTAMFIHGGFMHIAGNMLYLWIFGNNVEDLLGSVRFVVFYFICGTVAAALQIAFSLHSPVPMIGASGAIAGVLGAYYIKFPQARVQCLVFLFLFITVIWLPAGLVLLLWFLLQVLDSLGTLGRSGAPGGVAVFAHIGGFVAGWLLIRRFEPRRRRFVRSSYW